MPRPVITSPGHAERGAALPQPEQLLAPVVAAGVRGELPDATQLARLRGAAPAIRGASPQLLYARLTEALCGRHPQLAMQLLHEADLLVEVLPELAATVDFSQESERRHKDVWAHTKTVVWQSVPQPVVRWAAVLHDIGKVPTRRFLPDGRVTFHGHAELGERMFRRGVVRRIAFPSDVRQRVGELIRLHLRPGQYHPSWTDSAVRRFAREAGPVLDDLLNLSRADITSKRPGKRKRCLANISALSRRIRALAAEDARPEPLPSGLGSHLMAELDLPPGRHIGELRRRLRELWEAGELAGGLPPGDYVDEVRRRGWLDELEVAAPRGL